ncbi:helix-turn-helix domain-containing protein [Ancylobacter dichloromethanicus]
MTPFGRRLREMRAARGVTLSQMAQAIGVSAAYLSALEHGKRGQPTWLMLQRIMAYFNVIWDEAEALRALADMSDPRVVVDTSGLSPEATELARSSRTGDRHTPAGGGGRTAWPAEDIGSAGVEIGGLRASRREASPRSSA